MTQEQRYEDFSGGNGRNLRFDFRGNGKGTWFAEYGVATMRNEQKGEYGEVSEEPGMTLEYKRVKKKAATKKQK